MKRNNLSLGLLFLVIALLAVPGVLAHANLDQACNNSGCHAISTAISITATTPKTIVAPGESFVVTETWSPTGATAKWPSVVNNNALFGIPAGGVIVSGSGSGTTTLTAPLAQGSYTVTVYVSTVSGGKITNFKNITITVKAAEPPVLTTINVLPATASVINGSNLVFTAAPKDQNGNPIAATITWTSSNLTVGNVDASGNFTALAVGTTTIKAANGTVNGTASVTVTEPPAPPVLTTITISPASANIVVNGNKSFMASPKDQYGNPITATIIWTSSNLTVGNVDASGNFTASAIGTTTIKAANGSVNGTASVTVIEAPAPSVLTTITISPASANIVVNGTQSFVATPKDQYGNPITATITWTSSNTTVGNVDASGKFTALAAGTATIKAENGTVNGTATVNVVVASVRVLNKIRLTPSPAKVKVGKNVSFLARTLDQFNHAISAIVTWASSNTTVGTIDSNGKFTALAQGTTVISATNGTISGNVTISVFNNTKAKNHDDENETDDDVHGHEDQHHDKKTGSDKKPDNKITPKKPKDKKTDKEDD
ncbi:MAG: Ig-like domain-containing protein [Candidatus Methanoperedens sp.]|nr:Ig-like domain-containing protein [Candidatus Methanoperedens sp.]